MHPIDELAGRLAPHYTRFDVSNRLLFTGHSHQAWPDAALGGLQESFECAAGEVDTKWETAFGKTEILRNYLREYYDDPEGCYGLGQNTHQLLVSWLSALDLRSRPKIITSDGEFHSMSRQLRRLEEEGLEIVTVPADSETMADDIASQIDRRTAAVMVSRVFFESSLINRHLQKTAETARSHGVPLLIDDYHGTHTVPLSLRESGLEDCFLLIGGYKYLQWGEGNCFLRYPQTCDLRPVVTGWFAAFNSLDRPQDGGTVPFDAGDRRFAGGTYDPAAQFRAAEVVRFFREQQLTPQVLRNQYLAQVSMLRERFLEQDFDPVVIGLRHEYPLDRNGGFLALRAPRAREIRAALLERGVFTDARNDILRFGPAPYTRSGQIEAATGILGEVVRDL